MLWLDKLLHPTVLALKNDRLYVAKGKLSNSTLQDLNLILTDHHISRGSIIIDGSGRVQLSPEIPVEAHQGIRNILIGV